MRRLDSSIDGVFYLLVAASVFILYPNFVMAHKTELGLLVGAEILVYLVSYMKFGKEVATH